MRAVIFYSWVRMPFKICSSSCHVVFKGIQRAFRWNPEPKTDEYSLKRTSLTTTQVQVKDRVVMARCQVHAQAGFLTLAFSEHSLLLGFVSGVVFETRLTPA